MRGEQSMQVTASPEQVYAVVSDMTRMGELSPECTGVEWLDGATGARPGARFVGHNRGGPLAWSREGRIVSADPGAEFSFVTEWRGHDTTLWSYRLEATTTGTVVSESYEVRWSPWWLHLVDVVTFRRQGLARNMAKTLGRLKERVENP
jgi:hypothetical protein